jgi:sialate O-acetylesterase
MLTSKTVRNTGLATAVDIGDPIDIHPKNKQEVGRRLALSALAVAYKQKVEHSGPVYRSMKIEGNTVRIGFDHTDGGLVAKGSADGKLGDFTIAGKDGKFVEADAVIDGETVVVSSSNVDEPVAVRYAWRMNPSCSLYNKADLPALPFRTDAPSK